MPRDSCDMVKASLPEYQSPEDVNIHPPERRLKAASRLRRYSFAATTTLASKTLTALGLTNTRTWLAWWTGIAGNAGV